MQAGSLDPSSAPLGALIGREPERRRIEAALGAASSGLGTVLLLEGDAGLGKTALLDATAAAAACRGMRVVHCAAAEQQQLVPFAAIAAGLPWSSPRPDPRLARLRTLLFELDRPDQGHESAVLEAILTLLDHWCAAGPVAVITDDAQWLDPAGQTALERIAELAAGLGLVVLAAARTLPDDTPAWALFSRLAGAGADRMRLEPMLEDDLRRVAERMLGHSIGPVLSSEIAGARGNPLHVHELVSDLRQSDAIVVRCGVADRSPDTAAPLIRSLTATIAHRVAALPAATRRILSLAAALGPTVNIVELAAIAGAPLIRVWESVEAAQQGGFLTAHDQTFGFRHDLIRSAAAAQIDAPAQAALRRQAAQVLIARETAPERIAVLLTGPEPLDTECISWLLHSVGALVARAPALAAPLLERAAGTAGVDAGTAATLRMHQVRALLRSGRMPEAEALVRAALSRTADIPMPPDNEGRLRALARIMHWLLVRICFAQGRPTDAAEAAVAALAQPDLPAGEIGRYHGFLALTQVFAEQLDVAEQQAAQAIALGESTGDSIAVGMGCNALSGVRYAQSRLGEALALSERVAAVYEFSMRDSDRADQFDPYLVRCHTLIELDRTAEAEDVLVSAIRHSDDVFPLTAAHVLSRARIRFLNGRWDDATAELDAARHLPDVFGNSLLEQSLRGLIQLRRGLDAPAPDPDPDRDRLAGHRAYLHMRDWQRALAAESQGLPQRALAILTESCRTFQSGLAAPTVYYLYSDLARLAATLGDGAASREVAAAAARLAARQHTPGRRATALLCRGAAERRPELLAEAAQEFRRASRPLFEALALELHADALAELELAGEAADALDAAISLYAGLAADGDLARIEARARELGIRRRKRRIRALTGWASLTPTERKVAEYVASGWSNSAIAAGMYLSRRTVESHVSRILVKLGLSSRVQVAVLAAERPAEPGDKPFQDDP